jgi:hypothetical protein
MGWIVVILALMIPLIAVVLDSPLGKALADYVSRLGSASSFPEGQVTQRVAALETEVDRLSGEVHRLEEETVFLHRLLEAKPGQNPELPPPKSST